MPKPLSELRCTFISSKGWFSGFRESDLLASLQHETTWTFKSVEGGHWPMLTIPDQLVELLDEIS